MSKRWTLAQKRAQSAKLSAYWKRSTRRKKSLSNHMKLNNPMVSPTVRKRWEKSMSVLDYSWNSTDEAKQKLRDAWHNPVRKSNHTVRMQGGSTLQTLMQANGNSRRIGKHNLWAKHWWDTAPLATIRKRNARVSKSISTNFVGKPNKGFVRGKTGVLATRFGLIRYDSNWEKYFLQAMDTDDNAVSLSRDFAIPYTYNGVKRHFLIDFRVELSKRSPFLIEIKCPYLLDTPKEKAKIRAARRYATNHGMTFILLASKEEAKEGCLCLKS